MENIGSLDDSDRPSQASFSEAIAGNTGSGWVPKPPKVLMEDPNTTPLELRSQIQLYATNEYVLQNFVSPRS